MQFLHVPYLTGPGVYFLDMELLNLNASLHSMGPHLKALTVQYIQARMGPHPLTVQYIQAHMISSSSL